MLHVVQRRGGFSDRNGIKVENTEMQYTSLDDRTRVALVNCIIWMHELIYGDFESNLENKPQFYKSIMENVYGEVTDFGGVSENKFWNIVKQTVIHDSYDSVLTLIEAIAQYYANYVEDNIVYKHFNRVFEKEYVGYRFVGDIIVSITDENEIESINTILASSYDNVKEHIQKATALLADREKPDYENSIKESISAVEAMCTIILGKKDTLGSALKQLEKNGLSIHPSLKAAFDKLYGYTSDANGIRHAGDLGGTASTFEEAKFMLVSCSAFVNYLIGISAKK